MSSEKNALLSDSDNSNDQFDSEISDEDRQGNTKPSDNESNSESEGDTQETEQVEYEQVELDPDTVNITIEELEDEDVELWLVRIPRHRTLTDDLVGAKFRMALDSEKGLDRLAGGLKGSYHFRDQGSAPDKNLRATFVVPTADGDGKLHVGTNYFLPFFLFFWCGVVEILTNKKHVFFLIHIAACCVAKPFTKSVSVTFDTHLTKLTDSTPAPRVYPRRPENLQQKYFAIGSSKSTVPLRSAYILQLIQY